MLTSHMLSLLLLPALLSTAALPAASPAVPPIVLQVYSDYV